MINMKDLKIFIFIWGIIFISIGLHPLFKSGVIKTWAVAISIVIFLVGLFAPQILMGVYKLWIKIGEFIGGIVSKVILFIIYFGLFTPISLLLKLMGKDPLNKKIDKSQKSYWIDRDTQPQSMKNQF